MKRIIKVLSLILCLCIIMPFLKAAAGSAKVVFSVSEPDAEGFLTVNVKAYDVEFDAFQFSINYDSEKVTPASWSTGQVTTDFNSFTKLSDEAEILDLYGYAPNGEDLINFVSIAFPDNPTVVSPDDYYVSAGPSGIQVVSFRFLALESGDHGIELATSETGNTFNASIPDGIEISKAGTSAAVNIVFSMTESEEITDENTTDDKDVMTKAERAENTIILQIGNYAAAKDGAQCHIYPGEKEITPYIKTDVNRTMVPVRFVAEQMGADVVWDDETKTVTITLGDDYVEMTIGSNEYTLNGISKTMDVAAEIKTCNDGSGNGRTMIPLRFVAEALGKAVFWDQDNELVIITEPDVPWQTDRAAEMELTEDVLLIISPLLRDTI